MENPNDTNPNLPDELGNHMRVLEMIDQGRITPEEGLELLEALTAAEQEDSPHQAAIPLDEPLAAAASLARLPILESEIPLPNPLSEAAAPPDPAAPSPKAETPAPPADAQKWQRWWMVPLWIGAAITTFGGMFMFLASKSAQGLSFWFFCASVPFILGLLVIVLAWQSRTSPWLHLRVRQAPGETPQRFAFSMPLPLHPTAWLLRLIGRWVPEMKEQAWDELLLAVNEQAKAKNPIFIQVDEEKTGEKVEIYIG